MTRKLLKIYLTLFFFVGWGVWSPPDAERLIQMIEEEVKNGEAKP